MNARATGGDAVLRKIRLTGRPRRRRWMNVKQE